MIYIPSSHPEKTSRIKENTGQLSGDPISISTVYPGLELQYLCVHTEMCPARKCEKNKLKLALILPF